MPSGSRTRPRLRRPLAFVGLEPTAPAFLWKPLHGILDVMKCAGVHVVWLTLKLAASRLGTLSNDYFEIPTGATNARMPGTRQLRRPLDNAARPSVG